MNTQRNNLPMVPGHWPRAATAARPGFSLIEILMVIAIISVLTAMAVIATTALLKQGQVSQTKALLQQLQGVETEFQINGGYDLFHKDDWNHTITPPGAPSFVDSTIERFVFRANSIPAARDMMTTVDKRLLKDLDGDNQGDTVIDPFGTAIEYRKRVTNNNSPDQNMPIYPRPFFVSAGQDEEFGTDDDLYSFDQE